MADIDDLFMPPNAASYEKEGIRHGPLLSYVGEKLRAPCTTFMGCVR